MNNKRLILPILTGILTNFIFGLSFLFSSLALRVADVFTLLSFRFLTAFIIMSAIVALGFIRISYRGKSLKPLLALGLLQPVAYFTCENFGISLSSSSFAGMMIALIPISVAVCSVFFLKERPTPLQWGFISLSVFGVLLIVLLGAGGLSFTTAGVVFLLLAAVCATAFNLLSRKLSAQFTPFELTYFMMGIGAAAFTLISLIRHGASGDVLSYFDPLKDSQFLISCAYLGILSSVVAFLALNYTLSKMEASRAVVMGNLCPIVSIAAGVLILHEAITLYQLVGSVLIITGVWGMQAAAKKPKAAELT